MLRAGLCGVAGAVVLSCALAVGGADVVRGLTSGHWQLSTFGDLGYALAPRAFDILKSGAHRVGGSWLWDPVIVSGLRLPVAPSLTLLGAALFFLRQRKS